FEDEFLRVPKNSRRSIDTPEPRYARQGGGQQSPRPDCAKETPSLVSCTRPNIRHQVVSRNRAGQHFRAIPSDDHFSRIGNRAKEPSGSKVTEIAYGLRTIKSDLL